MSGLSQGYMYAAPMDFYGPRHPLDIWEQIVPRPPLIFEPVEPDMMERCRQRLAEIEAEAETLRAMIAAAEKAKYIP